MVSRVARAAWWALALGGAAMIGVGAPSAHAQESTPTDAQGQVGRVVVRGTRFIEDAAVLANVGLRPGELNIRLYKIELAVQV